MDDARSHRSSFGAFGWTNYSPAGLAFLGVLTLFPRVRKAVGYLILILIAATVGLLVLGTTMPDLSKLALLPLLGAALLFFPFWLPAVVLGWFGKKAAHRFAAIVDETNVGISNDGVR